MRSQEPPPPDPEKPPRPENDEERFGPLRLRRITKADGRALTFFTRADPEPESRD